MKAAIYARVSTTDQNCEMQLTELREYIVRHGWENAGEYVDTGWSGGKASRPEFDRLMADAGKRTLDVVLMLEVGPIREIIAELQNSLAATPGPRRAVHRNQPEYRHR